MNYRSSGASAPSSTPDLAAIAKRFLPDGAVAWAYLDGRVSPYGADGRASLALRQIVERSTLIVLLADQAPPHESASRRAPFLRHRCPGGRLLVVGTTAEALAAWVEFARQWCRSGTEIVRALTPGDYEPVPLPFGGAPTTLPRRGV